MMTHLERFGLLLAVMGIVGGIIGIVIRYNIHQAPKITQTQVCSTNPTPFKIGDMVDCGSTVMRVVKEVSNECYRIQWTISDTREWSLWPERYTTAQLAQEYILEWKRFHQERTKLVNTPIELIQ